MHRDLVVEMSVYMIWYKCALCKCIYHKIIIITKILKLTFHISLCISFEPAAKQKTQAPTDTVYRRWTCYSGFKLLCKLCQTFLPPAMGARFTVLGHAGRADPMDDWRCCSQKRVMSRPIKVRQL